MVILDDWLFTDCYYSVVTPCGYEFVIELIVLIFILLGGIILWRTQKKRSRA